MSRPFPASCLLTSADLRSASPAQPRGTWLPGTGAAALLTAQQGHLHPLRTDTLACLLGAGRRGPSGGQGSAASPESVRLLLIRPQQSWSSLCALSHVQLCLIPTGCSPPGSSVHGHSPGEKTGVGCPALLRGPSRPRDRARVSCGSCTAGGFFTTEPPGKPLTITGHGRKKEIHAGKEGSPRFYENYVECSPEVP